jgi:Ala-tRNA(Pro) deacylase
MTESAGTHGIDAVLQFLDREDVQREVVEHRDTFAAMTEAHSAGVAPEKTAKTVVLHDSSGLRIAVVPASERLDLHKARSLLGGTHHMRLATEQEIERAFPAFDAGAIPPFAALLATPEAVDRRLMEHSRILCSGGDHAHSLLISPHVLDRLGAPLIGDLCEH